MHGVPNINRHVQIGTNLSQLKVDHVGICVNMF